MDIDTPAQEVRIDIEMIDDDCDVTIDGAVTVERLWNRAREQERLARSADKEIDEHVSRSVLYELTRLIATDATTDIEEPTASLTLPEDEEPVEPDADVVVGED